MLLSFKYRLYPTRAQTTALNGMLRAFCGLYNAGLEERIDAYRKFGKSLKYVDQANELKAVRAIDEQLAGFSYSAEQQVLRRLDKAFKAFFRRCREGKKPGFPRFRAGSRYHSAEFRVGDGLTIRRSNRVGIVGIPGEIKCKWHRELAGETNSAILTRQNDKWYVVFHVEVKEGPAKTGNTVALDLGLSALVALSNGERIERPDWTERAAKGLRRRQRELARCKRNSKHRAKVRKRLAVYHTKVALRRCYFLHKLTADLVKQYAGIGIEDLNIRGMARGILAKDVLDAAWAQLVFQLCYKAAKAGGTVVKVDPRGTSQTCPECGSIKAKTLAERMHRCECGCVLDRDVAAARIVHLRAFGAGTAPGA